MNKSSTSEENVLKFAVCQREEENTNEIVQKAGALMVLDIDDSEISISHRLPSRTSNRSDSDRTSPPIIVRFVRRVVRDQFLHRRSKLKNFTTKDIDLDRISDNKIFIQESLTFKEKRPCSRNTLNSRRGIISSLSGPITGQSS